MMPDATAPKKTRTVPHYKSMYTNERARAEFYKTQVEQAAKNWQMREWWERTWNVVFSLVAFLLGVALGAWIG